METNTSHSSVAVILLIDGLTSLAVPSGEVVLESLMRISGVHFGWLRYEPFTRDGITIETTNVFPSLFGITPDVNPGRAGLERMLDGDLHNECDHFAAVRAPTKTAALRAAAETNSVHARTSRYSADGKTWLICSPSAAARDCFLEESKLREPSVRVSHVASPVQGWRQITSTAKEGDNGYTLVGWCHGALLSALVAAGVRVPMQRTMKLGSPAATRQERIRDLAHSIPPVVASGRTAVVYLKDPAWDARRGVDKLPSLRYASAVLGSLLSFVSTDQAVLVLSDHNSEVGVDATVPGPTACGVVSRNQSVVERWPRPSQTLSQEELMAYLASTWL